MSDTIRAEFLSPKELAEPENLDKTERTLARWRERGEGPPYVKIGKTILYRKEAVRDWLHKREVKPVREAV